MLVFPCVSAFAREYAQDAPYAPESVKQLLEDYHKGEYGDEVYQLYAVPAQGGGGFRLIIAVTDGEATLTIIKNGVTKRQLSAEEYHRFASYVADNDIDELYNWTSYGVLDGISYGYTHIRGDEIYYIRMTNPEDGGEEGALYGGLTKLFRELMNPERTPVQTKIRANGSDISPDAEIFSDRGNIHVPQNFGESLGAVCGTIGNEYYGSYYIIRGSKVIIAPIGARYIIAADITGFDGLASIRADVGNGNILDKSYCTKIPLQTVVIREYIPLRAVCEALGAEVTWNGDENLVDITIGENTEPYASYDIVSYINLVAK